MAAYEVLLLNTVIPQIQAAQAGDTYVVQGFLFALPITPLQQMSVGIGIAVAVTLLRIITTQPIAAK